MMDKDQMWEVLTVVTADRDKWKYHASSLENQSHLITKQSKQIDRLQARVEELERQVNETK